MDWKHISEMQFDSIEACSLRLHSGPVSSPDRDATGRKEVVELSRRTKVLRLTFSGGCTRTLGMNFSLSTWKLNFLMIPNE